MVRDPFRGDPDGVKRASQPALYVTNDVTKTRFCPVLGGLQFLQQWRNIFDFWQVERAARLPKIEDFLDDLNTQLKKSGLSGLRFRDATLQERREQFEKLLQSAGEQFRQNGIRTLMIVDGLDHIPREERPERSLLAEAWYCLSAFG